MVDALVALPVAFVVMCVCVWGGVSCTKKGWQGEGALTVRLCPLACSSWLNFSFRLPRPFQLQVQEEV